ncbi:hypothetical protein [Halarcobacter ebronensis]|uniref:Intracellular septation protein A n=1 Tax=Halarcobacter ebronensis TaxID=1462615 RepID=A0A4Q1APN4_9BACT|nr:hypothetical protein [Halarcobacter ebronensis]QKF83508.1 putative membrane protein [Halarcobacter ebronensis]RXK08302.1 hypothetical protein CRV07_00410 [Halarcobacter ebronensis]
MNLLISIVYAPIVIYLLNNFDIKKSALFISFFSFLWFVFIIKKAEKKELVFPVLYLIIGLVTYFLNSSFSLKLTPLLFSLLISFFILYSYLIKESFIFIFLKKLKIEVAENEKIYIHKSTLFWFLFSIINSICHYIILYTKNDNYWMFYSSIGWYFLFFIAAFLQFLHRKLFFKGI